MNGTKKPSNNSTDAQLLVLSNLYKRKMIELLIYISIPRRSPNLFYEDFFDDMDRVSMYINTICEEGDTSVKFRTDERKVNGCTIEDENEKESEQQKINGSKVEEKNGKESQKESENQKITDSKVEEESEKGSEQEGEKRDKKETEKEQVKEEGKQEKKKENEGIEPHKTKILTDTEVYLNNLIMYLSSLIVSNLSYVELMDICINRREFNKCGFYACNSKFVNKMDSSIYKVDANERLIHRREYVNLFCSTECMNNNLSMIKLIKGEGKIEREKRNTKQKCMLIHILFQTFFPLFKFHDLKILLNNLNKIKIQNGKVRLLKEYEPGGNANKYDGTKIVSGSTNTFSVLEKGHDYDCRNGSTGLSKLSFRVSKMEQQKLDGNLKNEGGNENHENVINYGDNEKYKEHNICEGDNEFKENKKCEEDSKCKGDSECKENNKREDNSRREEDIKCKKCSEYKEDSNGKENSEYKDDANHTDNKNCTLTNEYTTVNRTGFILDVNETHGEKLPVAKTFTKESCKKQSEKQNEKQKQNECKKNSVNVDAKRKQKKKLQQIKEIKKIFKSNDLPAVSDTQTMSFKIYGQCYQKGILKNQKDKSPGEIKKTKNKVHFNVKDIQCFKYQKNEKVDSFSIEHIDNTYRDACAESGLINKRDVPRRKRNKCITCWGNPKTETNPWFYGYHDQTFVNNEKHYTYDNYLYNSLDKYIDDALDDSLENKINIWNVSQTPSQRNTCQKNYKNVEKKGRKQKDYRITKGGKKEVQKPAEEQMHTANNDSFVREQTSSKNSTLDNIAKHDHFKDGKEKTLVEKKNDEGASYWKNQEKNTTIEEGNPPIEWINWISSSISSCENEKETVVPSVDKGSERKRENGIKRISYNSYNAPFENGNVYSDGFCKELVNEVVNEKYNKKEMNIEQRRMVIDDIKKQLISSTSSSDGFYVNDKKRQRTLRGEWNYYSDSSIFTSMQMIDFNYEKEHMTNELVNTVQEKSQLWANKQQTEKVALLKTETTVEEKGENKKTQNTIHMENMVKEIKLDQPKENEKKQEHIVIEPVEEETNKEKEMGKEKKDKIEMDKAEYGKGRESTNTSGNNGEEEKKKNDKEHHEEHNVGHNNEQTKSEGKSFEKTVETEVEEMNEEEREKLLMEKKKNIWNQYAGSLYLPAGLYADYMCDEEGSDYEHGEANEEVRDNEHGECSGFIKKVEKTEIRNTDPNVDINGSDRQNNKKLEAVENRSGSDENEKRVKRYIQNEYIYNSGIDSIYRDLSLFALLWDFLSSSVSSYTAQYCLKKIFEFPQPLNEAECNRKAEFLKNVANYMPKFFNPISSAILDVVRTFSFQRPIFPFRKSFYKSLTCVIVYVFLQMNVGWLQEGAIDYKQKVEKYLIKKKQLEEDSLKELVYIFMSFTMC